MANSGATGIDRILRAFVSSWRGLRATFRHEEAFRQELILVVLLAPLSLVVGDTPTERALLFGSLFLILIIEVLNSGIEATVDRFGPEQHKLAARAKDMGSAAVLLGFLHAAVIWLLIVWP
ncbi:MULTISPECIES: diacylglycerol kinase [unclassified Thioalkalivibrio]|uniref:diacylglycerol kinase n=1 Tax=unclassified Thioalkalivibrio TaxID=2621013 RepID=UPI0003666649|nr:MULTISPECIES: diacylglycerol kinase [unclassified Thioalkalivibrio]